MRFDTDIFCIVKDNPQKSLETIPGPPLHWQIELVINLKGKMQKADSIYKLTPAEDKAL